MLNRVTQIGEDGATSGVGLLASYSYDDHGRRTNVARAGGAGATTAIGYDGSDRISRLAQNFTGAAADVTWTPTYSYNPSPQAVGIGSTNDAYAWHGAVVTRNYVANGLNQYATVGPNAWTYDGRGNLMSNTADSYTYDPQNRLLTASGPTPVTLTYDPIGHLRTTASGGATTTFLYAGDMLVGEYDASGNILRRYVPGPGTDEPLVWYEGAGTSDRRWLHADTAGSVVGYSDSSGNSGATYAYDPYGLPPSWSAGDSRYRYTGQLMIPEANLYYYKARMYDPANGRFLQTDPVGYQSDINLYAYVGNDPINGWDPSGMVSAECNEDQCQWVDSPGGGYAYDNGNVTITCSQGTFEGGGASSGDCTSSADNDYELRGGGGNSGSGATGGGSGGGNEATTVKELVVLARSSPQSTACASALNAANRSMAGVNRALANWGTLSAAAAANGIDPALLAAVGVRETNFQNIAQQGGGGGMGVFQLTNQPGVSSAQAYNLSFSANYAAHMLSSNMRALSSAFPSFTPSQLLQATAASYNLGLGGISGNPNTIDVGTTGGNYGSTVVGMMGCFR